MVPTNVLNIPENPVGLTGADIKWDAYPDAEVTHDYRQSAERFSGTVRVDAMQWDAWGENNPDELNALLEEAVGEELQDIEWEVVRYEGSQVIIALDAGLTGGAQ
tara:strand:- start:54 stop:368 length:315 start_codon:yes stop_codon:yes gene_type:complete